MKSFWDERFGKEEYAYGKQPNEFFKQKLNSLKRGKILLPCEGEGRNVVYAAQQAWYAYSFDSSEEGRIKAQKLAKENFVQIQYDLFSMDEADYELESFDCIGIFFAHFKEEFQAEYYKKMASWLKQGGHIILELFSKSQAEYQNSHESGGPRDELMLISVETIEKLFPDFEILYLEDGEVELDEGVFHQGLASTVRFLGRKKISSTDQSIDRD